MTRIKNQMTIPNKETQKQKVFSILIIVIKCKKKFVLTCGFSHAHCCIDIVKGVLRAECHKRMP